ncbi:ATP-binding cassette domain-containing protein [Phenylobacterium sp. VNQ135]|uniref:ATP-binding cassette domain-containing protein n=1 Tax=Phenylobacterium sp. VNQ135 TaxID=3400922 RepID=UPI003C028D1C
MSGPSSIRALLRQQAERRRGDLAIAAAGGAAAAAAAALMLGLSGWFLAGAALAGAAGPAAVQAFNYLLPSAGLRAFAILRTVGRYGERLFAHRAALRALAVLRPALFAGIAASPPERALALSSGEASARLVQDVDAVETLFVRRPAAWTAAAATLAGAGAIAVVSRPAAAVFVLGVALQILAMRRWGRRLTAGPAAEHLAAAGQLKDALGAYAPASAELRCFGMTDQALEAVMTRDTRLSAAVLRRRDAEGLLDLAEALLTTMTLLAVAALTASSGLPLAALAVLSAFAGFEGVGSLVRAAREHSAASAAITRLDAVAGAPAGERPRPTPAAGELQIDGAVLPPGRRVALSGPSGAGKTTLMQALLGLRPAPPGRLRVDGRALEEEPPGWTRRFFAYAPQDARLLTGSVADNLRLGAPDADEAALWQALADAQLQARVQRLPQGLDTWIGDGGEVLSGGERRRLALARALLRPAPWLLLDEPTEGLDASTEAAVVEALEARLRRTGQGLVLISHRPAPLRLAEATIHVGARPGSAPQPT